jgi:methyl-accepting chemotaxis protein
MISDIARILSAVAQGQVSVDTNQAVDYYKGDFHPLISNVQMLCKDLRETMGQITVASNQVDAGAAQVANTSQSVASGSTEQASAVEELAATIDNVSEQAVSNYNSCISAKAASETVVADVEIVNNKIAELQEDMALINKSTDKINQVVKAIDDIAFQTNILALNAAVEAARAGNAGKGFSVVADEVRNLATKSQEAVKETTELIQQAISDIKRGVQMSNEVNSSIKGLNEGITNISTAVVEVAENSETQTNMIQQIQAGIDQISDVIQSNTATSEESAAASEELSGQAQTLKQLISKYR